MNKSYIVARRKKKLSLDNLSPLDCVFPNDSDLGLFIIQPTDFFHGHMAHV